MFGKTGKKNPMFGRTGEKSPNYGKRHTDETLQKMSEIKKAKRTRCMVNRQLKVFWANGTQKKASKRCQKHRKVESTQKKRNEKCLKQKWVKTFRGTCRRMSESKETSECKAARKFFFSLPSDMDLKEKRKCLRQRFPNKIYDTIYSWCKKFDSEI